MTDKANRRGTPSGLGDIFHSFFSEPIQPGSITEESLIAEIDKMHALVAEAKHELLGAKQNLAMFRAGVRAAEREANREAEQ